MVLAVFFSACSGNDSPPGRDAGPDAVTDGAADSGNGGSLPTTCTGDCQTTDFAITIDASSATFERAYFGLTSPAMSERDRWEIYVEASAGGDGLCPTEDSPTPDRLLILAGLPVPESMAESTDPGLALTFLDFEGSFLSEGPLSRATSISVAARAANPCVECAEGGAAEGERLIALTIDGSFAEGPGQGRVYATHCDSLDDL